MIWRAIIRRSPELISYEEVTDWVYHLPSFRLHLVLLSFPLNLLEFRDSGLRLLRKIQWIDLFIDEFRIRCLGIVRFCSAFIRSHSSRISPILPLRSLDIFEIQRPVRTSNLRLIGQRENVQTAPQAKKVRIRTADFSANSLMPIAILVL